MLKKAKPRSMIPVVCKKCDLLIANYAELMYHVMHYHKELLSELIKKNRYLN